MFSAAASCMLLLVTVVSGCGQSSWGSKYSRGEPAAGFPSAEPASSAYLVVPADHRVYRIEITSRKEGLRDQLKEMLAARDALRAALEKTGEMTGFRAADPALKAVYPAKEKDEYNSMMVLATFKQAADPLKQMQAVEAAVAASRAPAGNAWTLTFSGTGCVLQSPENYREQLVMKARDNLRALLAPGPVGFRVHVSGLEKPLTVTQASESEFLVSLPYTVTVELTRAPETAAPVQE